MDGKNKIPAEAVELYNQFIHGEISRRAFVNGIKRYAAVEAHRFGYYRRAYAELCPGPADR